MVTKVISLLPRQCHGYQGNVTVMYYINVSIICCSLSQAPLLCDANTYMWYFFECERDGDVIEIGQLQCSRSHCYL